MKEAEASTEALERRARSIARLDAAGVRVDPTLPVLAASAAIMPRPSDEIAWRAMALLVVAGKGDGLEPSTVARIIDSYGLADRFTPAEQAFLRQPAPSSRASLRFVWGYEAGWTLLWAIGYVDDLGLPVDLCDVGAAIGILQQRSATRLIDGARARPVDAILDEAELIFRCQRAIVDARAGGSPPPPRLEPGVTRERARALTWLIGKPRQAWDDIAIDS